MKINKMLKYEPKTNIRMLILVFLNAIAFDSMCWMIEIGEVVVVKWTIYTVAFVLTLTWFKIEFKRLNTKYYDLW